MRLLVICCALALVLPGDGASILTDDRYAGMRRDFLNLNTDYLGEVIWDDEITASGLTEENFKDATNILGSKMNAGGYLGWYTYGANHICPNSEGEQAVCRMSTGGSSGNNQPVCGSSVGNDYATATSCTTCWCNNGTAPAPFSGVRYWISTASNFNFVAGLFPGMAEAPSNRLCYEVELNPDDFSMQTSAPSRSQVVNLDVVHANLTGIRFEVGTYTSNYKGNLTTTDDETGGTYQGGGTHFYHKPSSYDRYPTDRAYALSDRSFVACFAEAPAGVRSGMRPPYYANPLVTVKANDPGQPTDAYLYWPYVTRAYFDVRGGAPTTYPTDVKFSRVWLMYERNDIFALDANDGVLGVDMIGDEGSAVYPFVLYNDAAENRTYRVWTTSNSANLAHDAPKSDWKVFVDANENGVVDEGEVEAEPESLLVVPGGRDLAMVAVHTPDWDGYQMASQVRWGRQFDHATFTLMEVGRLRGTSYMVRTHRGTPEDLANKTAVLASMVYSSDAAEQKEFAEFNHEKPGVNLRLVRNSPDYLMAKMRQAGGTTSGAATSTTAGDTAATTDGSATTAGDTAATTDGSATTDGGVGQTNGASLQTTTAAFVIAAVAALACAL